MTSGAGQHRLDADEPSKGRLLIVDDHRDFAAALRNLLAVEGYEIDLAHDGDAARAALERFDAEVVLLDLRLEAGSGLDLIAPLKEQCPGLVFVIMTAYAKTEAAIEALRRGAYDFLHKPIDDGELRATLERAFERTRLEKAKLAAEQALRESAARLRGVLRNMFDGIITITEDGAIESFNHAVEKIFGYPRDEAIGKNLKMLLFPSDSDRYEAALRRYVETGERTVLDAGTLELAGRRKDGSSVPIELAISEMRVGDKRLFVGVIRDITERLAQQAQLQQAQKMEAIGQLTGGVAHDFNNLLTIVLGNLELLLRRLDDDDLKEMVVTAERAGRRGAELTQRLLAFGRRQSLEPRVVDLNRLVLGMTDLLRRTLGKTIEIETVVADAIKPTLVDPAQVENAILNLAINARDAMPKGGVLTIRTVALKIGTQVAVGGDDVSPGEYVMLAISDTGTGMPPDVAERAFDPFFTTKEVGRGSGLGLSMIYGFCRQSGGFATIDSETDQGSTVSLFLPATDAAEEIDATASTGAMDENGHETVLVVEDDPGVRLFAATVLGSLDYNVIEAADGRTALETLESNGKIDVLFTDIQLPGGIDGRDIANQARTRQPDINILFTSGFAVDGENRDLMEITMLRKPYTGEELAAKIRGVIENLDGEKQ